MLQENILKERDYSDSIRIRINRIISKFAGEKVEQNCDKQESRTLLDYQNDINANLEEVLNGLELLEKVIGD